MLGVAASFEEDEIEHHLVTMRDSCGNFELCVESEGPRDSGTSLKKSLAQGLVVSFFFFGTRRASARL